MHAIAREVAREKIAHEANFISSSLNNEIQHLSHYGFCTDSEINSFGRNKIGTFLQIGMSYLSDQALSTLLAHWICLRALDLSDLHIEKLPSPLANLLHLRYLDLSGNYTLQVLPSSIAKLHNLQALTLRECVLLRELPRDLSKLTKLRLLDTRGCNRLRHMPRGIGKLSCLQNLPFSQ